MIPATYLTSILRSQLDILNLHVQNSVPDLLSPKPAPTVVSHISVNCHSLFLLLRSKTLELYCTSDLSDNYVNCTLKAD